MSRRALVGALPDRVRISHFTRKYIHNKDYRALIISLFTHSSRKYAWAVLLGIEVLVFDARWAMASGGIVTWGY